MKTLYIAWQDPDTRSWYPVGQLSFDGKKYIFAYTQGATASQKFTAFQGMGNFDVLYESEDLFPFFLNRILTKSRPEYGSLLRWLKMEEIDHDPLSILALTEGVRKTDTFEMFACPSRTGEGKYEIEFFSHGLSHLDKSAIDRTNNLQYRDHLYLLLDVQNNYDPLAIALRTGDPKTIVGYCPRYLNEDFRFLVNASGAESVEITVEQVNKDAPLQFRLLCRFSSPWPQNFRPCTNEFYRVRAGEQAVTCNIQ